ncbi:hypothetical protein A7K94_0222105 [Modestobacter sp. VKM Ac-2676]|nr:hypothetical protein A7K94_0222105 [Modestobacter sp. VKM Ac-2676]
MAGALRTAAVLEELGHTVAPATLHGYSEEAVIGYMTHVMDASVTALPYVRPELAEPYLQYRMERARRASAADYVAAAHRLQRESRQVAAQFGRDFDVLLTPTMATLPVPAGLLVEEANADPEAPGSPSCGWCRSPAG